MVDTHASAAGWPAAVVDDVRRARRRRRASRSSTPTSTSTTPSATACSARRTARCRSTPTRWPPRHRRRPASGSRQRYARRRRTTRTRDEVAATEIVPRRPHLLLRASSLDLGDRVVELVHPGRGHTGGDLVVRVPDADVLLAGDLVEESPRAATCPASASDCFPMEWPLTLDIVLGLTTVGDGRRARATARRSTATSSRSSATTIGIVAETIRDLATRGVPVDEALAAAEWPYPRERARARRTPRLRAPAPQPEAAPARLTGTRTGVARGRVPVDRGHDRDPRRATTPTSPASATRSCPRTSSPSDDNPLAERADDAEADRQDLGDPHIDGLGRDEDDNPDAPDDRRERGRPPRGSRQRRLTGVPSPDGRWRRPSVER